MTTIEIREVHSKADLETFMSLPTRIYAGFKEYVPPLMAETRGALDPAVAPFFKYGEAVYWLAYRDGKPVGRISAQIDRLQNHPAFENAGLFGCLDTIDDFDVTKALIDVAEDWLRSKGFERAIGPTTLNTNGLPGLLVEGHEREPMTMAQWHPPYLEEHLAKLPYKPIKDLHFWRLQWSEDVGKRYATRAKLPDLPQGITLRNLDFKNLERDIETFRQVFNDAWKDNWGFVPLQPEDVETISKELKPLMRPEMGVVVERQGKPVAVMLVIPNVSEMTADLGETPSPIGWIKLAWRAFRRKYNSGRIFLFGVRQEMRYSVGGAVIAMWLVERLISLLMNMKRQNGWVEAGWVLDDNKPLQTILIGNGFQISRTMRLFERELHA